jgi:hypothetical protein
MKGHCKRKWRASSWTLTISDSGAEGARTPDLLAASEFSNQRKVCDTAFYRLKHDWKFRRMQLEWEYVEQME